jgi:hypothetical protein
MKYEDNEFDALLKDSLKELREAEPRAGLEGRLLAGVGAASRVQKTWRWQWAAVAAMVILIVLGIAVRRGAKNDVVEVRPTQSAPEIPKVASPQHNLATQHNVASIAGPTKRTKRRAVQVATPGQKVESASTKVPFPAPAPLTDQEKALVLLAQNHPQVVRSVGISSSSDDPLAIPKVKIEPIKVSENREEER